ncbi:MAG: HYR domain-containing protein, partial [Bacteroidales bacterium]|nr:HYR domain-containing protein [Bacteroidales bacterium]
EVDSVWNGYNQSNDASDTYIVGTTDVWWYAVDIYGNTDSCMMSVTVVDTIAPVITCPNDTIVYAMADSCWADVVLDPATATDNCEVDNIWNDYNNSGNASDLYPVGVTDIWWFAVDIYGNIDSCMMSVEVIDTIPPQITCPPDESVYAGLDSCSAYVFVGQPVTSDNCGVDSVWNSYTGTDDASAVYDVGIENVWWYAIDTYGNIDSCEMFVTVEDIQPPYVYCPNDTIGYANDTSCAGWVDVLPATALDNCEVDSIWNSQTLTEDASAIYDVGTTDIWWYGVDIYGNIDSCMMVVTVLDTIIPVIDCPDDTIAIASVDSCSANLTLPPPAYSDNCGVDSVWNSYTGTGNASGVYNEGVTEVWWYVVDDYGNMDSCLMLVTVIDSIPPEITCPPDETAYAGLDSCSAYVLVDQPITFDNCGIDSVWNSYTLTDDASAVYDVGVENVWWYAVDIYGNIDSCMMTVTVEDIQPPYVYCPADTLGYANDTSCAGWVEILPATALDNCEVDSIWNSQTLTGDASAIYDVGTTFVWWFAVDIYGNTDSCLMNVTVIDTVSPIITCPPDTTLYTVADSCWAYGNIGVAVASDNCIVDSVWNDYTGTLNSTAWYEAVTEVTWFAADIHGNMDSCTMTVTVLDDIPPVIICPDDAYGLALPDSCWGWVDVDPAVASDNCALDSIWNDYTGNYNADSLYPVGVTTVWWYAVDMSGNMDSCSMNVIVSDSTPPIIICPDDIIWYTGPDSCEAYVPVPLPEVFDNCAVEAAVNDYNWTTNASDVYPLGTTAVWWYVLDYYGNGDSCMMTITVLDTIPPVITCPPDTTIITMPDSCWAYADVGIAIGVDNCTMDSVWNNYTGISSSLASYPMGVTTLTWYAVDSVGNIDSCYQTVTVVDTIPPTIVCPDDITWIAGQDSCSAF